MLKIYKKEELGGKKLKKKMKICLKYFFLNLEKKMIKILGAKNRWKNLHKHPGPSFQIRGGPGSFSNASKCIQQKMFAIWKIIEKRNSCEN